MQPEVKEKPKVERKQPTPTEQWDILAAKVISQELAPKGFKKLTSGSYRGLEIANHSTPGITKATVRKCQNIGASLVRGFREKVREGILDRVKETEALLLKTEVELNACWFWQFSKVADLKYKAAHLKGQIGKAHLIAEELNSIDIK